MQSTHAGWRPDWVSCAMQARKQFPMLAEFAARMNCGGTDVASTASFMREMMHSTTRGSYDNVIATQTFADDEDEEEVCLRPSPTTRSCSFAVDCITKVAYLGAGHTTAMTPKADWWARAW